MNATILRYRFQKVKNAVPLSIRGVAEIDLELFASRVALPTGWALNEPQSSPPGIGPTATRRILAWYGCITFPIERHLDSAMLVATYFVQSYPFGVGLRRAILQHMSLLQLQTLGQITQA